MTDDLGKRRNWREAWWNSRSVRYWPTTKAYLALGRETVPADVIDTDRELGLLPPPRGPR